MGAAIHPDLLLDPEGPDWEFPMVALRAALRSAVERGLFDQAHADKLLELAEADVLQPERITRKLNGV